MGWILHFQSLQAGTIVFRQISRIDTPLGFRVGLQRRDFLLHRSSRMDCLFKSFDLELSRLLTRLPQVKLHLHPQPGVGSSPPCFFKPDRHVRRDTRLAVNKLRQCLSAHAETVSSTRHRQL